MQLMKMFFTVAKLSPLVLLIPPYSFGPGDTLVLIFAGASLSMGMAVALYLQAADSPTFIDVFE